MTDPTPQPIRVGRDGDAIVMDLLPTFSRGIAVSVVHVDRDRLTTLIPHANTWHGIEFNVDAGSFWFGPRCFVFGWHPPTEDNTKFPSEFDRDAYLSRAIASIEELNRSLRPKRKVKVEAWAIVYEGGGRTYWRTKDLADEKAKGVTGALVVPLTGEVEVDDA